MIEGRAVVIPQDHVDTDVLYPGPYLSVVDPERMKDYLFEGLDPGLRKHLGPDAILVVGDNFGAGSSREHVPLAMKAWGVRCLVGKSFARIFYRNCINLGLLAVQSADAVAAARMGSRVRVQPREGWVEVDGRRFAIRPVPDFVLEIVEAGGLEAWGRRLAAARG